MLLLPKINGAGYCPYDCKPLPNCLGHWAAEHDMAEGGQLILTGCMWAEVLLRRASVDVPVEGSEELAVQQTPGHHSSRPIQGS